MPIKKTDSLISIEMLKHLIATDQRLEPRYEFLGFSKDGVPVYEIRYLYQGEMHVLVSQRFGKNGVGARKFKLAPGLVRHNETYGQGRPLVIWPDFRITQGDKPAPVPDEISEE